MKVILFVLVFSGGQPSASLAPAPSMGECEKARMEVIEAISKDPQIEAFVTACHKVLPTQHGTRL